MFESIVTSAPPLSSLAQERRILFSAILARRPNPVWAALKSLFPVSAGKKVQSFDKIGKRPRARVSR
jgi:hypothetical protein